MLMQWLKNVNLSPRTMFLPILIVAAVFVVVSIGVLLCDVTRDDVVALHRGLDGKTYSEAGVGSFFEVSVDRVHGPLCANRIDDNDARLQRATLDIHVINKLGETLPILTGMTSLLFEAETTGNIQAPASNVLQWQIADTSVTSEVLWQYTREIMDGETDCGSSIDQRTANRQVRICPVYRVWKDGDGRTEAVFFDPISINGCRGDDPECSAECPDFAAGQLWTRLKIMLDLLEIDNRA